MFVSSTCFEPDGSSSGRRLYTLLRYGSFTCIGTSSLVGRRLQDCLYWCMWKVLYRIITACTTVFLKMNHRVQNMWKIQTLKVKILTLSDPTSDLVRHYDFPIPLRCRVTPDTFFFALFSRSAVGACSTLFFAFVRPLRCRSLSDTFPHVVQSLANK